ncbi:MAG: hypothetical protein ACERKD_21670 [Prolixibacteraceae bacterium]
MTHYNIDCHVFNKNVLVRELVLDQIIPVFNRNLKQFLYISDFFQSQLFGSTMERYYADFREVFQDDFEVIAGKKLERCLKRMKN